MLIRISLKNLKKNKYYLSPNIDDINIIIDKVNLLDDNKNSCEDMTIHLYELMCLFAYLNTYLQNDIRWMTSSMICQRVIDKYLTDTEVKAVFEYDFSDLLNEYKRVTS